MFNDPEDADGVGSHFFLELLKRMPMTALRHLSLDIKVSDSLSTFHKNAVYTTLQRSPDLKSLAVCGLSREKQQTMQDMLGEYAEQISLQFTPLSFCTGCSK